MRHLRSALIVSLALLFCPWMAPAPVLAAPTQKPVTVQEMDTDHDGKVTKQEFLKPWTDKKAGEEAFQRLDRKGKGHITSEDLMGHVQAMDSDHDGKVSLGEWSASWQDKDAARDAFRRLDANGDGYLSPDEFLGMWPGIPFLTW